MEIFALFNQKFSAIEVGKKNYFENTVTKQEKCRKRRLLRRRLKKVRQK